MVYTGRVLYTIALDDQQIRIVLRVLKWMSPWYDHKFRRLLIFHTKIDILCHFSHSDVTLTLFIYSFHILHLRGFVPQCEHNGVEGLMFRGEETCQVSRTSLGIKGEALDTCQKKWELAVMDRTSGDNKCFVLSYVFCLIPGGHTTVWNRWAFLAN